MISKNHLENAWNVDRCFMNAKKEGMFQNIGHLLAFRRGRWNVLIALARQLLCDREPDRVYNSDLPLKTGATASHENLLVLFNSRFSGYLDECFD